MIQAGRIHWVSGPVIRARVYVPLGLLEQVWVGERRLAGEVIASQHDLATVQVYEETSGLRPGEPLWGTGRSLTVALGPGLLGQTFDGIQRPLERLLEGGVGLARGARANALPDRSWPFTPAAREGDALEPGALLGTVPETGLVQHRVRLPPRVSGRLTHLAPEGPLGRDELLAVVTGADGREERLTLVQHWPVREARPVRRRLTAARPLITGQRVLDTFFPLARGGAAALPGPFGAGKTVLQHSLAKWSDADVIVYVGCGERGNEMAQVLREFPELVDPGSGRPLLERTVLIANTSNMPVAAREASINTGLALAEYYRDMGYHVALMADSTSRWAEALREIAGRLEEMPAEEGYPAYLPSRLAAFYERAGLVETASGEPGSVTIIGAVSPPGGDFTEPVTQHTQRFTRAFWALSRELASARHYPAVGWQASYSFYADQVGDWWEEATGEPWLALRHEAATVLEQDARLEQMVRLVGSEALPDRQRWVLASARLLKEGFLRQNALHPVDAYCVPEKQARLLALLVHVHRAGAALIDRGVPLVRVRDALPWGRLLRLKETVPNDATQGLEDLGREIDAALEELSAKPPPLRGRAAAEAEKGRAP